jgi:hypothetical protein
VSIYSIFILYAGAVMSRESSIGIATGYGLGVRGSIPGRGNNFLFSTASRPAPRPTKPIKCVPRAPSLGVERPGCKADLSLPSSAEVNNGGAIPALKSKARKKAARSIQQAKPDDENQLAACFISPEDGGNMFLRNIA